MCWTPSEPEAPFSVPGLADYNVAVWYGQALKRYLASDEPGASIEFEMALDHLVARRGPLGSDGLPAEGEYVLDGGGFRCVSATPEQTAEPRPVRQSPRVGRRGGWEKPVAPPTGKRPGGLPPVPPAPLTLQTVRDALVEGVISVDQARAIVHGLLLPRLVMGDARPPADPTEPVSG